MQKPIPGCSASRSKADESKYTISSRRVELHHATTMYPYNGLRARSKHAPDCSASRNKANESILQSQARKAELHHANYSVLI